MSERPRGRTIERLFVASLACAACASTHGVEPRPQPAVAKSVASEPQIHPIAFWKAVIADGYRIPTGEDAGKLLHELHAMLSSTDPEVRDDVPYDVMTHWLFPTRRLDDAHWRVHLACLRDQMLRDVDASSAGGDETVLGRSFAALHLSLLAASDLKQPFLSEEEWCGLYGDALRYLAKERDVRGYVAGTGWHHSVAHTADLLKFLARSPHLRESDQPTVLADVEAKLDAVPAVLAWGEDERLAEVLLSIVRRADFDAEGFESWVRQTGVRRAAAWRETPLDPTKLVAAQNMIHVLRAAYVRLRSTATPSDAEVAVGAQVLNALNGKL